MVVQHPIRNDVADCVKLKTVNGRAIRRDAGIHRVDRLAHHLSLDQTQIKLHARQARVGNHHGERFAIDDDSLTHRPQLGGQIDLPCPVEKCLLGNAGRL